ncbi:helix-turn-helix transcriptional regulator [Nocardioides sambongensis]|uniref:helix-turn-helix transcriptional regulator n=1 Tax=Nocardioides sambongensis TaxID=2589074 RepID=UPI00112D5230|nr:helix-turn-helix transcriptional regulator [Nocardioides sambongensis]
MARALTERRVRQDVDVVARAGLTVEDFIGEAVESVGRAVPWVAACVGTHDPDTRLLTSARKYGHLKSVNSHDHQFGLIEYGTVEPTAFGELARAESPAAGVHLVTDGDVERSGRMAGFMRPHFDFGDEARVVFRDGEQSWGGLALFRGVDDPPFDATEIEFLASLAPLLARGVRTGILGQLAEEPLPVPETDEGPAVIIVGPHDEITSLSSGLADRMAGWLTGEHACDPLSPVSALVGAARRYGRGEVDQVPRCRIRTPGGTWLVLHAGPLSSASGHAGEVVITIERARPPEIASLVMGAFGLTPRERDVARLVLQGRDTKEIAATLHLSAYTIQDHLKVVFDKAGVRSRRELVQRVFVEQYQPRMGGTVSPSGWFV